MTDRELLELAAKAAGIKKDDSPYNGGGFGNDGFDCTGNMVLDWHNNKRWNPLTDDGDALRLAVTLRLTVNLTECQCCAGIYACQLDGEGEYPDINVRHSPEFDDAETTDPYAATRRAIVRAAAEIGKAMT